MTIFDDNFLMTIFDDIETIFDNWKDSPGDLTFETLITILTIENLNSVNHSYLTINCDTGQHSQFLRCFTALLWVNILIKGLAAFYSNDIFVAYFTLTMYDNVLQESPGQERFGDEFAVITAVTGAVRGEGARGVLPQLVALLPPI